MVHRTRAARQLCRGGRIRRLPGSSGVTPRSHRSAPPGINEAPFSARGLAHRPRPAARQQAALGPHSARRRDRRSEEHTSELQSRRDLVCRLLLEKKKKKTKLINHKENKNKTKQNKQ